MNRFISLLICCCIFRVVSARHQQPDSAVLPVDSVLKVGVKKAPPFVEIDEKKEFAGVSVGLWEHIARQMDLPYEYVEYTHLQDLIGALENGEIDISINPLTVTSRRAEKIDFSQPFFITNLAIATDASWQSGSMAFLKNFFSVRFFEAVSLLFLVLLIFGLLVWFFEKDKDDSEFDKGFMKGIADGLWWSAVTMTTVGYGDKAPKTRGGRIVAVIWMFTAIMIISGFTASIASSLTVSELESSIKDLRDLRKIKVSAVHASTGASFLKKNNIYFNEEENIDAALKSLAAGNTQAVVYDEPLMVYSINHLKLEDELSILPYKFSTQYYSLSFPKGSRLHKKIDPFLLREIEGVEWKVMLEEFRLGH